MAPIEYSQATTLTCSSAMAHMRWALVKTSGNSPKPVVVAV